MKIRALHAPIDESPADLTLIPLPEGRGPLAGGAGLLDWRLEGRLSRLLREGKCAGRDGERFLLLNVSKITAPAAWIEGMGRLGGRPPADLARRLWETLLACRRAGARRINLAADLLAGGDRPFPEAGMLARALEELAAGNPSKMAPEDVTLFVLEMNLF